MEGGEVPRSARRWSFLVAIFAGVGAELALGGVELGVGSWELGALVVVLVVEEAQGRDTGEREIRAWKDTWEV